MLPAMPTAAQDQPAEGLSALAQVARQRSITTCLSSIDAFAKEIGRSYDIGAFVFNQIERPDEGLVSISLELSPGPSGAPVYMSANFVAKPGGGCQVMVETTVSWDSSCAAAGLAYPQYRVGGHLLKDIGIAEAGGIERLFLIPTVRSGCIAIEKSVFF